MYIHSLGGALISCTQHVYIFFSSLFRWALQWGKVESESARSSWLNSSKWVKERLQKEKKKASRKKRKWIQGVRNKKIQICCGSRDRLTFFSSFFYCFSSSLHIHSPTGVRAALLNWATTTNTQESRRESETGKRWRIIDVFSLLRVWEGKSRSFIHEIAGKCK